VAEELQPSASREAAPLARRKSKAKWIWAVLLVLLIVGGLIGWQWSPTAASRVDDGAAVKFTLHLETFVINLSQPDENAYLRVGVDLGLDRELPGKDEERAPSIAAIRDTVLGVLAASRAQELLTAEGKQKLKDQILAQLQRRIPELRAREVYFTEFLIQR
jgi:flagellar FliL protein